MAFSNSVLSSAFCKVASKYCRFSPAEINSLESATENSKDTPSAMNPLMERSRGMFGSFQGRLGQTISPTASTSRPYWTPLQSGPQPSAWRRGLWTVHAQLQQEEKAKRKQEVSENEQRSPQNGKTVGHQLQRVQQSSKVRPAEQVNHNGAAPQNTTGAPMGFWENLPSRYKLVFACAIAFVICNMDKVNISVAIIYMSQDFGWSPTVSGIVQSSFFAGYMCTQIPGGYVVSKLGGRKVLPTGVSMWSAATAATPLLAGSLPGILLCRILVGLGEGVAPTSATDMVASVLDKKERSRSIGFIFSGLHVGSLAGLLVAPVLIERFGWPAVFYMFGVAGLLWSLWWERLMAGVRVKEPEVADKLESRREVPGDTTASRDQAVPWRAFIRSTPVRSLAYVHFCNNWNAYVMTAWLPSYFSDALSLDLTDASHAALFPPIAAIAASAIAAPAADYAISQGVPVGPVRKIAQAVAFLGPALFLGLAMKLGGGGVENETLTVGLLSAALGLASVSVAGLYSNHADVSPRHASILLGLTNTMGAVPGIIGVTFTGIIFDNTRDWNLALFSPSIFFFLTGTAVFALFGSAEEQSFEDNQPFWFEKYFAPVVRSVTRLPVASMSSSILSRARSLLDKSKDFKL